METLQWVHILRDTDIETKPSCCTSKIAIFANLKNAFEKEALSAHLARFPPSQTFSSPNLHNQIQPLFGLEPKPIFPNMIIYALSLPHFTKNHLPHCIL